MAIVIVTLIGSSKRSFFVMLPGLLREYLAFPDSFPHSEKVVFQGRFPYKKKGAKRNALR
jgi:hypothetical protein